LPPPQKIFSTLSLKMATFSAFWVLAHAARGGMAPPGPLGSASDINLFYANSATRNTVVSYNKINVMTCHGLLGVRDIALTPPITLGGQVTTMDLPHHDRAAPPHAEKGIPHVNGKAQFLTAWTTSCLLYVLGYVFAMRSTTSTIDRA